MWTINPPPLPPPHPISFLPPSLPPSSLPFIHDFKLVDRTYLQIAVNDENMEKITNDLEVTKDKFVKAEREVHTAI